MQHLTEEQLVAHYYHDDDAPAAANDHLASCAEWTGVLLSTLLKDTRNEPSSEGN